jgi:uncharacterized protein
MSISQSKKAFLDAIIRGKISEIEKNLNHKELLSAKTAEGLSPMELCLYVRRPSIFRKLYFASAPSERKGILHIASALKNKTMVEFLLKQAVDVNEKDKAGRIPLHWSVQEGSVEVSALLIEAGSRIDAVDDDGFTPLSTAVGSGHVKLVKFLYSKGSKIDKKICGSTYLHLAIAYERVPLVKFLLEAGAKVNAKDDEGETPYSVAQQTGNIKIVNLIRKAIEAA